MSLNNFLYNMKGVYSSMKNFCGGVGWSWSYSVPLLFSPLAQRHTQSRSWMQHSKLASRKSSGSGLSFPVPRASKRWENLPRGKFPCGLPAMGKGRVPVGFRTSKLALIVLRWIIYSLHVNKKITLLLTTEGLQDE